MAAEVRVPDLHPTDDSLSAAVVTEEEVVETNGSVHSFDGLSGSTSEAGDGASSSDELATTDRDKPNTSAVARRWPWSRFRRKRKDRGKLLAVICY